MKAMLDYFGYRWMPHRPAKEMFGKRGKRGIIEQTHQPDLSILV
jgi:hypothetical protein